MPRFRGRQVLEWVYRKGVADPQRMTNLSQPDRDAIQSAIEFQRGQVLRHERASDGTQKLLIDWGAGLVLGGAGGRDDLAGTPPSGDGGRSGSRSALPVIGERAGSGRAAQTECVMIPATSKDSGRARKTACVSSQIGCPVGCKFCASGLGGLDGNLTAGQIVQQAWQLGQLPGVAGVTNVVFMGMGEPLANFEAVTRAARIMIAAWGLGISGRRVTISTVGVPSGIRRLAELDLPVTLAISLHAPNDRIREQIIPWAQFVTIQQLIDAGRYYFEKTGREVTLEYILLGGVNDQVEHARELVAVAGRLRANVNLIRYNEVRGLPFNRPDSGDVHAFQDTLRGGGINTHIRASRGRDIAAACGQLRHEHAQTSPA